MPEMDGYEATRAIRALPDPALASIPVIAMTANAFSEDVQAEREAGMNAHITKPLDIRLLNATVKRLRAGNTDYK
jgi:CheY-like chemotaxis protein